MKTLIYKDSDRDLGKYETFKNRISNPKAIDGLVRREGYERVLLFAEGGFLDLAENIVSAQNDAQVVLVTSSFEEATKLFPFVVHTSKTRSLNSAFKARGFDRNFLRLKWTEELDFPIWSESELIWCLDEDANYAFDFVSRLKLAMGGDLRFQLLVTFPKNQAMVDAYGLRGNVVFVPKEKIQSPQSRAEFFQMSNFGFTAESKNSQPCLESAACGVPVFFPFCGEMLDAFPSGYAGQYSSSGRYFDFSSETLSHLPNISEAAKKAGDFLGGAAYMSFPSIKDEKEDSGKTWDEVEKEIEEIKEQDSYLTHPRGILREAEYFEEMYDIATWLAQEKYSVFQLGILGGKFIQACRSEGVDYKAVEPDLQVILPVDPEGKDKNIEHLPFVATWPKADVIMISDSDDRIMRDSAVGPDRLCDLLAERFHKYKYVILKFTSINSKRFEGASMIMPQYLIDLIEHQMQFEEDQNFKTHMVFRNPSCQ